MFTEFTFSDNDIANDSAQNIAVYRDNMYTSKPTKLKFCVQNIHGVLSRKKKIHYPQQGRP